MHKPVTSRFRPSDSLFIPANWVVLATLVAASDTRADLASWQSAVEAGTVPVSTYFTDIDGPAISGLTPVSWDAGFFDDARTFEFVVFAGGAGGSSALMGFTGISALKFEQWNDTSSVGITQYGVRDHDSGVLTPFYEEAHLVFASDGVDTHLYVNGEWQHTFAGLPLDQAGEQWFGGIQNAEATGFSDPLDGHILGFASYNGVLGETEIAAHHAALAANQPPPVHLSDWQAAVNAGTAPFITRFDPLSILSPTVVELGEFPEGTATFEFVVRAGGAGASSALMGRSGAQGLKYEQYDNTGFLGLTNFGVADITSEAASIFHATTHVAYVSDGASTTIYLNGEPASVLEGTPLALSGAVGLGAASTNVYGDPLDGEVLRFASYDTFLDESEIQAHYAAFAQDAGAGAFTAWDIAATTGTTPAYRHLEPVSGTAPVMVNIGALSDDRTFEFIVSAGDSAASACLMGNITQGLKFEQWNNTGNLGMTNFGVADFDSGFPAPFYEEAHLIFSSDGTDTYLYVNGELAHVFSGTPLTGSGFNGLGARATVSYFDRLDGHIFGFAGYKAALGGAEIAAHAKALREGAAVPARIFKITQFSLNAGQATLSWESTPGKNYEIKYSSDLTGFSGVAATGVPASTGATTAHTFALPSPTAAQMFFIVKEL